MKQLKENGFSDAQIAKNTNSANEKVRDSRIKNKITPSYKLVDTCSAEFKAKTPYCYSTYDHENDIEPLNGKKIMILGGGPNRIGQGLNLTIAVYRLFLG